MPVSESMYCSSSPVPSVATTSACVSPRVNSAEPWVRGSTPTSETIGRTVERSRPSMRELGVEDVPADDLGLEVLEHGAEVLLGLVHAGLAFFRREVRLDLGLGGVDGGVALLLVGDLVGGAQVGFGEREHVLFERRDRSAR
jgi:hypothetical protein